MLTTHSARTIIYKILMIIVIVATIVSAQIIIQRLSSSTHATAPAIIDKTNGVANATFEDDMLKVTSPQATVVLVTKDGETYKRLSYDHSSGTDTYFFKKPAFPSDFYVALSGDVDLNASVDATDALRVRQYFSLNSAYVLSPQGKAIADIDLNGNTEETDALRIKFSQLSEQNERYVPLNWDKFPDTDTLTRAYSELCEKSVANGATSLDYKDFVNAIPLVYDDYLPIKGTHTCASQHNLPVVASKGEYDIYKSDTQATVRDKIAVTTDTNLGDSTFYIHDETGVLNYTSNANANIFSIPGQKCTKLSQVSHPENIKLGGTIPEFAGQANYSYVTIRNNHKLVYRRSGSTATNGEPARDSFKVNQNGKILDPIYWSYDDVTDAQICPLADTELTFKNGNFYTIIDTGEEAKAYVGYVGRGLDIYRNNTTVDHIKHVVVSSRNTGNEALVYDINYRYMGFFYLHDNTDIKLTNSQVYALKSANPSGESVYDLNISAVTNSTVKNVTMYDYAMAADKDQYFALAKNQMNDDRWGVMGTDYSKNITFDQCVLNRIDDHRGFYNLTVDNSIVGKHALTLGGFGDLNINNVTVRGSKYFLKLRNDYGSSWDGHVNIANSQLITPTSNVDAGIVYFKLEYDTEDTVARGYATAEEIGLVHDYGYDLTLPTIEVHNFKVSNQIHTFYAFANGNFSTEYPPELEKPAGWVNPNGNLRYVKEHCIGGRFEYSYPGNDEITIENITHLDGSAINNNPTPVTKYLNNF